MMGFSDRSSDPSLSFRIRGALPRRRCGDVQRNVHPMKTNPLPRMRRPLAPERREREFARGARLAHRVGVPQVLARLVGLECARYLCRDTPILARHD